MGLEDCMWNVYGNGTRNILGILLLITGFLSISVCGLAMMALCRNNFRLVRACASHGMLLNLCVGSFLRSLFGFLFSGTSALAGRWLFGDENCQLYGFLRQFLFVYQIESITHLCIERYVVSKYTIKYGWKIPAYQYPLYIFLCIFFASLYSIPPLFGVGRYGLDYSCTWCTLDLNLAEYSRCVVIGILLLQSVKPVFVIVFMLQWTSDIEKDCKDKEKHSYNIVLTENARKITWWTLLCWAPGFITSACVVSTQITSAFVWQPLTILAAIGEIGSEIAPGVTSLSIIWTNQRLRHAIIQTFYKTNKKAT